MFDVRVTLCRAGEMQMGSSKSLPMTVGSYQETGCVLQLVVDHLIRKCLQTTQLETFGLVLRSIIHCQNVEQMLASPLGTMQQWSDVVGCNVARPCLPAPWVCMML